ncbi:MAG: L,D-transpeptidase [Chloroflexi bacterium]|nr:L,D-transpeptidase [Chloroflexota bacterium]
MRSRLAALGVLLLGVLLLPVETYAAGTPTPVLPRATATATQTPPSPTTAPTASPTVAPTAPPTAAPTTPPTSQPTQNPTTAPEATVESSPTAEPLADDAFTVWHGVVRDGGAYRRSAPSSSAEVEEELDPGTPLRIDRWVSGSMLYPDVYTWGVVDPADGGGYVFGGSIAGVLPPAVPPARDVMQGTAGNWLDVNLTLDVVTAYQDGQPVMMMLTSPGRPGYETDTGLFRIRSKLPQQGMSGPGYFVPNVPNVQYFVGAEALHGRYWTLPDGPQLTSEGVDDDGVIESTEAPASVGGPANGGVAFGVPSSHGCLGLQLDDASWLYHFTALGLPVDVHD